MEKSLKSYTTINLISIMISLEHKREISEFVNAEDVEANKELYEECRLELENRLLDEGRGLNGLAKNRIRPFAK